MPRSFLLPSVRLVAGVLFLTAVLPAAPAAPAASAPAPRPVVSVEGMSEYVLPNGLRLLLVPDPSQSKVTVNMTVLVGSRHEGYGETGMAHLLEHLVFKGTPRHPQVPKALQDRGAQFNGSTSTDRTNYYETLAATDENLDFALGLEADRLVNSFIKREDLLSEMTVVRNEFERGENSPGGVLRQRISAAAYEWHNYGKSTIGNRSDIERVPIENLREFYRKHYQPDNVIVIVAGKFEPARALALAEKHFGPIPRPTRTLTRTWTEEPPQDGERLVTLRRVGVVPSIGVAYHVPSGSHEDAAAVQVLASILSTPPSGRLYRALVEPKKASGVFAYAGRSHDPGLLIASADVAKEVSPDEVRDLLVGTLENLAAGEITDQEVARARQQLLKARELAANDTAQLGVSLSEWAAQGDWRLYFLHRDRLEQVTAAAVKAAAARYLRRSNRTVGVFVPTDQPDRVPVPPAPDLAKVLEGYQGRAVVAAGEAFEATPANIESRVRRQDSAEGVKLTLLPKKSRGEEVHLTLTLRYGDETSLRGLEAAAGLLPQLMLHGTKRLSYQQLRDELDRLGATLGAGGGGGGRGRGRRGGGGGEGGQLGALSFSIQAKRGTLPEVLGLLRQVLREPALPADHFAILKAERLANLEESLTEPSALAPRRLQRELAPHDPSDVRYVPTLEESVARLKALTHADVTRLYRDLIGAQAGELAIVGDFDPAVCVPLIDEMFRGWKAPQPYARIPNPAAGGLAGTRHTLNTPDKANATYVAGLLLSLRDDHPDYPALVLGNYILGAGTLGSRLGVRIRQQEGLSYGVTSSLSASAQDTRASFAITAICNPQNMARLEVCVREELQRLLRDGVTAEELAQARQGYLESQKVARASDVAMAGSLAALRHVGRTMEWQAQYEERLRALTPEVVNAALRRHLDPAKLVIVTAGDFQAKPSGGD